MAKVFVISEHACTMNNIIGYGDFEDIIKNFPARVPCWLGYFDQPSGLAVSG
jgi:hypothetical protein